MSLFDWFKGKQEPVPARPATRASDLAPGTQIHYEPGLVERFKGHHAALVDLTVRIRASVKAGDFAAAARYVHKFKLLLNEHLLEENLRLYTYLTHCLVNNEEGSALMAEMRREMGGIGRAVAQFIRHHEEHGIDATNATKFLADFEKMVLILADRIEREERSLYTMYLPPAEIRG